MGSKTPEEAIDEFLAAQPSWLRKVLQHNYSLTADERAEFSTTSNWPEKHGQARDRYLELLQRCPARLKQFRKSEAKSAAGLALQGVPKLPAGAKRKHWIAEEAWALQEQGMSQPEIAMELNKRHPDLRDLKGNPRPITAEVVRKHLAKRRESDRKKSDI